jgi:hypothetical protein
MIRTQGTLIVKKIKSRNGPFRVADLVTDVAEFKVKDALLDQLEEGEYRGTFFIAEIFLAPYVAFGRCVTELRARLHDMRIDSQDRLKRSEPESEEPDPIDETPAPSAKPKAQRIKPLQLSGSTTKASAKADLSNDAPDAQKPSAPPAGDGSTDLNPAAAHEALFGAEIHELIQQRAEIRLDPTIDDRARFRAQTAQLRDLGYRFDSKRQVWLAS